MAGRLGAETDRLERTYQVLDLADEFSDVLRAELHFDIEARHAMEMTGPTESHAQIRIPRIVDPLTTERMLVMERLIGTPLSKLSGGVGKAATNRQLADELCAARVGAMLDGERLHGDPHPGNVLILEDGSLGLVDFGITGRLDLSRGSNVETQGDLSVGRIRRECARKRLRRWCCLALAPPPLRECGGR